ncbi:aldo-keto reductase family protein [Actinacidiphila oryziradicis]|uniref:Uncharacterized protein n=1 Tax=Actinacidiphila oryziradicis TaxID=2571141 RepID=A0A4U0SHG8_9ACTN|nr:hypothetical protein [Actinacidiphila oryziradicis]TKA08493.1 hypothetical protein FCI23_27680 [Actinacidiphila oryziradicis]
MALRRSRGVRRRAGVASWNPTALPTLVHDTAPRPDVLMVRAGLLVGIGTLDAADALREAWDLGEDGVWGMSPFGGSAFDPVWDRIDPRTLLPDARGVSRVQAAFRAAYHLPGLATVAVGTDDLSHLRELVDAVATDTDGRTLADNSDGRGPDR